MLISKFKFLISIKKLKISNCFDVSSMIVRMMFGLMIFFKYDVEQFEEKKMMMMMIVLSSILFVSN